MKKSIVSLLCVSTAVVFLVSCGSTPTAQSDSVEDLVESSEPVKEEVPEVEENVDNSSALEKAEAARRAALNAGADKDAADQFVATDELYQSLKVLSDSGKDVSDQLYDVQKRFDALAFYSNALKAKKTIDDNGFVSYDQATYDAGCNSLSELDSLLADSNSSTDALYDTAKSANGSFLKVIFMAYKKLAKEARTAAFVSKKDADTVKAGVAAKDAYKTAVDEFKSGDSCYSMQNPEAALEHYNNSKEKFDELYETVSAKRAEAQKAIDEAKAKVLESQNYAQSADENAPLEGDDVNGIESEDTVLLEPDEYEDPATQEIELSETVDEESFDKVDFTETQPVQDDTVETEVQEILPTESVQDVEVEDTKSELEPEDAVEQVLETEQTTDVIQDEAVQTEADVNTTQSEMESTIDETQIVEENAELEQNDKDEQVQVTEDVVEVTESSEEVLLEDNADMQAKNIAEEAEISEQNANEQAELEVAKEDGVDVSEQTTDSEQVIEETADAETLDNNSEAE